MVDLVTGGTGFIGQNLVKALVTKGTNVRVLVRKNSNIDVLKGLDVEIVYGDLDDKDSLIAATKNIDIVYHLAAQLGGPNITYKQLYRTNVIGTEKLLNACFKNRIKKFIHFSSVSAMGEVRLNADEETPCNPVTPYDKTKLESELLVKKFIKERNLSAIIIRPSMLYGPGETKTKATIFRAIKKGVFVIIGNGNNLIDMSYIDNIIDGVLLAVKNKKAINQTYILADERAYTMNEFFNTVAKEERVRKPIHLPKFLAYLIALPLEILAKTTKKSVPLSFTRVRTLTISKSFSIDKAKKELGYKPKINLQEGIRRTVNWYRERGIL
jgi:nucleoside-diphosphate-sugar epimerase